MLRRQAAREANRRMIEPILPFFSWLKDL